SLSTKYALQRQATRASILIFIVLAIVSITGFSIRILLENYAPDVTASTPPTQFDFVIIIMTVSLSFTIFSVVYSLAAGRYSQVDYESFRFSFTRIFDALPTMVNSAERDKAYQDFSKDIKEAIDSINKALPYETGSYREFVVSYLSSPLEQLKKF